MLFPFGKGRAVPIVSRETYNCFLPHCAKYKKNRGYLKGEGEKEGGVPLKQIINTNLWIINGFFSVNRSFLFGILREQMHFWLKCSYRLPWHSLTSEQQRNCSQSYSCKENFQNLTRSLFFYCCCSSCRSDQDVSWECSLQEKAFEHISSLASPNCFTNGALKCVAGAYYLSVLQSGLGKTAFVFKFR